MKSVQLGDIHGSIYEILEYVCSAGLRSNNDHA